MTAGAAVAAVDQAEQLYVVRVRMRTNQWTSPGMTREDAAAIAEKTTADVAEAGGSFAFVEFESRDGRSTQLRAREVISVEVRREEYRPPTRPAPAAARTATGGSVVHVELGGAAIGTAGAATPGTAFLRQQAAAAAQGVPISDRRSRR